MQTGDARVMCGTDVRRGGIWPEDMARVEALALRYGGTVTAYPVGHAAVCVEWNRDDHTVTATGATAADALHRLATQMTGDL